MIENKNYDIRLEHISISFGKRKVLNDVNLQIKQGEIFGLLGPSGCGKSTTVKIMAGILRPDVGNAYILNRRMPDFDVMGKIGYMAQAAALYPTMSAYENLAFFGSLFGLRKKVLKDRIDEVLQLVNLAGSKKQTVGSFSGGMKQRLSLAATLLPNPSVLILDEPTVGIDPLLRQSIWNELIDLSQKGVTIIVTTHVMDEANKCNRLAMMRDGKILMSGTAEEICSSVGVDTVEDAFISLSRKEGGLS